MANGLSNPGLNLRLRTCPLGSLWNAPSVFHEPLDLRNCQGPATMLPGAIRNLRHCRTEANLILLVREPGPIHAINRFRCLSSLDLLLHVARRSTSFQSPPPPLPALSANWVIPFGGHPAMPLTRPAPPKEIDPPRAAARHGDLSEGPPAKPSTAPPLPPAAAPPNIRLPTQP